MAKRKPNKKYKPEFKQLVIKTMQAENLSYKETARRFEIKSDRQIRNWEKFYLTEGPENFFI